MHIDRQNRAVWIVCWEKQGMSTFDLFSAVRDGNAEVVHRLLQTRQFRARLNARNEWGDTALHLAAEAGNSEICHMLKAAGASVTVRNNRGETCLHRSSVGGHVEACRTIVGTGQDPEVVNSTNDAGYTALHHAARHGSRELIEILLKANADRMIENNAGETPYMVAQRFQQYEAERLLLNIEQQHADQATSEMNQKEKDIIRAYLRAVRYASHLESRIRIVLVGDTGTGKSALKKTVYGECYDPRHKPTLGIDADPSITRITFKQFREWVLQNASKADTRRLNLEYIDITIDYILNALQQPWVSDDAFDIGNLQIAKGRVPTVGFNPSETVIPESLVESEAGGRGGEGAREEEEVEEVVEGNVRSSSQTGLSEMGGAQVDPVRRKRANSSDGGSLVRPPTPPSAAMSGSSTSVLPGSTFSIESTSTSSRKSSHPNGSSGNNSRRVRSSRLHPPSAGPASSSSIESAGGSGRAGKSTNHPSHSSSGSSKRENSRHLHPPRRNSHGSRVSSDLNSSGVSSASRQPSDGSQSAGNRGSLSDISESLFRAKGELSRLLVENIPREILKRMVIRWPVGDEPAVVSRAELNRKRLMITLWDVSGDPLQHNFTPFFFSHRCLFVSMYNLTRDLDQPCESYAAKNLRDVDGRIPTNAEALEEWLGYVNAFCKPMPSVPFRCSDATPVLPPVILACSFSDDENVRENPINFHNFFSRPSFSSYRKHLVESNEPSALIVSSKFENEGEEDYAGHHLLRREIDHLARQMPFCRDNIPIQWIKFEQLICGLQEQKKIIVLYNDLTRYVAEHCNVTGTLQFLPILSHFHDIGVIMYFYRHPLLSNIVITKPQWLADALSSVIASSPSSKWVTTEVQVAFTKLSQEGIITKEMLLLAYRCGRMHQRYWSETLFILNCMDLICCHPSCHESASLYVPCLVTQPLTDSLLTIRTMGTADSPQSSAAILHFSSGSASFPIAVYNQFVVRCIRSSCYAPKLFYCSAHLRLGPRHHLIVSKHRTSISIHVQSNHEQVCPPCAAVSSRSYPPSPKCSHIQHIVGEDVEYLQSDNISTLIEISTKLNTKHELRLPFAQESLAQICQSVLEFTTHNLNFLTSCWFPGLRLELIANIDGGQVVINQHWRHTVLTSGSVPTSLRVWFR